MANQTKGTITVGASLTDVKASRTFTPKDRLNMVVEVRLSAVTEAAGITLKLLESGDGEQFADVGDESEVTLSSITCASATDVANATETFTETSHGLQTGFPLIYLKGSTIVAGLTDGATYYLINKTANTFQLAATYLQATQGTPVAISDDGVGNQIFHYGKYEIRMVESDATDAAQLPTQEFVCVGVTTGAGDTITISKVLG